MAHSTTTKYYTYEEDAPGTEIGNLSQDLKIEPGEDLQTSFRFMQKTNYSVIHMRQMDGLLTVGESIDREELCPQSPKCIITFDVVAFSKEKFQLIHVEIEVRDINDNSPQFPFNETYLEISENLPVGTRFPLHPAIDRDVGSNYIQSYQISYNNRFGIEVSTGEDGLKNAELVLLKKLDRELEDFYTIEVTAMDGGRPPKTGSMAVHIKVLDFNDNSPTFEHSSLKVELNEDAPLGFLLLKVHAFDPDDGINGEVVYGFVEESSNEVKHLFHIDPFSGSVTLNAIVDYETKRSYELNIQAYDLGMNSVPSTCKVIVEIVDVNDNAPEISIKPMTSMSDGVAYITEAAAEDSFVALISTSDRDSGPNGYVRSSLHGHEHFKLQQAYGDTFMIVTTTALDREKIPEYNLTVVAEDLGSPPFKTIKQYTIRVSDENDNPPLFSKPVYEVSVMENNVPGSYIATVVARDPDMGDNSKVTYKLIDGEVNGGAPLSTYVSLDPISGSLYSVRSFDYESVKQIEVKIQASDNGSPQLSSTALIEIKIVDQNDNAPYITHPVLQNDSTDVPIPYNAPPGYIALRVKARDADEGINGELSFQILEDEQMLFSINKESGEMVLKYGLSFLHGDVLKVKIGVSDKGRSPQAASATVRFLVTEMEPEDQIIMVVEASTEARSKIDASLIVIIMLGGGCALLLVAIVAVALSCKHNRGERSCGGKKKKTQGLFERSSLSLHKSKDSSMYSGPRVLVNDRIASSHDDSMSLYGDRAREAETKAFHPFSMKHFEPVALWQGDKYSLQLSGIRNNDQLSVKDSGKGDSDFNDSDSDISGDGCKKSHSTFNPRTNSSFHSANTLGADQQGGYCIIPTRSPASPCSNAYTIAFTQVPAHSHPNANSGSWRGSAYSTNISKARAQLQTFPRTGTLPLGFGQHKHETGTCPEEPHQSGQEPAALAEVATTF
ncbi:protocadherin-8-like [Scleropages formosus]|uniref:Protocadherin-8 n=1 Tax=Scleropages formosus TaxID=113540 RepID=A0A0P7VQA2_SCLFO|nr:protocadherin-8-like [Scleropages formosus]